LFSSAQFILETPRLLVCQYTLNDADNFFALNSDAEVMRYIRLPKTRKECDAFLVQNINFYNAHSNLGRWAAYEKNPKEFIGSFAIIPIDEETGNIQIGYALMRSSWGKGFATELVQYGKTFFFNMHGADVLYGITEHSNKASQNVLLKCGFQESGTLISGDKKLIRFSIVRNTIFKNQYSNNKVEEN
jgi:RimJ/RimL family protein N-acetyltransferase